MTQTKPIWYKPIEDYLLENLPKRIEETHVPGVLYTEKFTWGTKIVAPVRRNHSYDWVYEKIGEISNWMISFPVYKDTDPKTLLDCFIAAAYKMEMKNHKEFVLQKVLEKNLETIGKETVCCQLLDWRFLPRTDEDGSIVSNYGSIALVKYALFACIPEEYLKTEGV